MSIFNQAADPERAIDGAAASSARRARSSASSSPRSTSTRTLDTVAVNLKTGKDASGHVSLRSAIMAADAKGGSNKIILPAGDVHADDRRRRRGQRRHRRPRHQRPTSRSQGRARPRRSSTATTSIASFQVLSGKVSITGVTIQHGRVVGDGGGILNSGGQVVAQLGRGRRTTWRSGSRTGLFVGSAVAMPAAMLGAAGSSTRPGRSASPGPRSRRTRRSAATAATARRGSAIAAPGGGTDATGSAGVGDDRRQPAAAAAPARAAGSSTRPARP